MGHHWVRLDYFDCQTSLDFYQIPDNREFQPLIRQSRNKKTNEKINISVLGQNCNPPGTHTRCIGVGPGSILRTFPKLQDDV